MYAIIAFIDKLTKEEEEIYKLQHDLERTVISQQQTKKTCEVRRYLSKVCYNHSTVGDSAGRFCHGSLTVQVDCRFYVEKNKVSHPDVALKFITSTVSEQTKKHLLPASTLAILNLWVMAESEKEEMI